MEENLKKVYLFTAGYFGRYASQKKKTELAKMNEHFGQPIELYYWLDFFFSISAIFCFQSKLI